mmetsp:Transcript_44807/g.95379  ORF Transcript_44807/g.95379 Transcript_44807/m.95379 type:complete len:224 (-) Transcript_44807:20-691(-)
MGSYCTTPVSDYSSPSLIPIAFGRGTRATARRARAQIPIVPQFVRLGLRSPLRVTHVRPREAAFRILGLDRGHQVFSHAFVGETLLVDVTLVASDLNRRLVRFYRLDDIVHGSVAFRLQQGELILEDGIRISDPYLHLIQHPAAFQQPLLAFSVPVKIECDDAPVEYIIHQPDLGHFCAWKRRGYIGSLRRLGIIPHPKRKIEIVDMHGFCYLRVHFRLRISE